jgi:hypothetical protein
MTDEFRIMRWWTDEQTPADYWRVERKLPSGVWIPTGAGQMASRVDAELQMAGLMAQGYPSWGVEFTWTQPPRQFPVRQVAAWTAAVGFVVYALSFLLQ